MRLERLLAGHLQGLLALALAASVWAQTFIAEGRDARGRGWRAFLSALPLFISLEVSVFLVFSAFPQPLPAPLHLVLTGSALLWGLLAWSLALFDPARPRAWLEAVLLCALWGVFLGGPGKAGAGAAAFLAFYAPLSLGWRLFWDRRIAPHPGRRRAALIAALLLFLEPVGFALYLRRALPKPAWPVERLVAAADGEDRLVREEAFRALEKKGAEALPALLRRVREEGPVSPCRFLWLLGGILPPSGPQLEALVDALAREQTASCSLSALYRLGPAALPGLTGALSDPRPEVRRNAASVLERLRPRKSKGL